ncbi:hypothetical protein BX600DRAFT_477972 [Xylariales sp. PMI_506]|nr:hypothetical protein BX600DRAFT_477972 [Xylariales sp. PMI_506]
MKHPQGPQTGMRKSRMGCSTCRGRKIKCDETKPACVRCTSTGRVCDGYSVVRQFKVRPDLRPLRCASQSMHMQPTSGILGTDNERRFFHSFKIATEAGVTLHVGDTSSSFWVTVAPRLASFDDAMKHALIALGATYHSLKITGRWANSFPTDSSQLSNYDQISKLEQFIIHHYNAAMNSLRVLISSQQREASLLALTCSLIFVSLENLRFNYGAAATHLRRGAQIVAEFIDVQRLFKSSLSTPSNDGTSLSRLVSNGELRDIVISFCHLENSERLFTHNVPLTITSIVYDGSSIEDKDARALEYLTSPNQMHHLVLDLFNNAMVLDSETSMHRGDRAFWSSQVIRDRHRQLSRRASSLGKWCKAFLASENGPKPGTREYAGCCQDILKILCMICSLQLMPLSLFEQQLSYEQLAEILHYSEILMLEWKSLTKKLLHPLDLTIEVGLVTALYWLCVYATDPGMITKALSIMSDCRSREGPWDGSSLADALKTEIGIHEKSERIPAPANWYTRLPKWGSDTGCWGMLSLREISK